MYNKIAILRLAVAGIHSFGANKTADNYVESTENSK